jgi:hypothetical protein
MEVFENLSYVHSSHLDWVVLGLLLDYRKVSCKEDKSVL